MYREPPSAAPPVTFPLQATPSVIGRAAPAVCALALSALGAVSLWSNDEASLVCRAADRSCELRRDFLVRGSTRSLHGPGRPLAFFVEPATIGKNGRGQALVLVPDGGDRVVIARGYSVASEVAGLEAFDRTAAADFSLTQRRDWGATIALGFLPIASALPLLLLSLVRIGSYLVADPATRTIAVELRMGKRVLRRTEIPVADGPITLGITDRHRGRQSLSRWLTLLSEGGVERETGLLDVPSQRDVLERALRALAAPAAPDLA